MIGVVASAQIMVMPLSSPGSDGVQWWHRHKGNLLGHFFFSLIHFLCLVSLCLNQAVCDKCCTVLGNVVGKSHGSFPALGAVVQNSRQNLHKPFHSFSADTPHECSSVPSSFQKTQDLKGCMQLCCHGWVLCMERSEGNHHDYQDRVSDTEQWQHRGWNCAKNHLNAEWSWWKT